MVQSEDVSDLVTRHPLVVNARFVDHEEHSRATRGKAVHAASGTNIEAVHRRRVRDVERGSDLIEEAAGVEAESDGFEHVGRRGDRRDVDGVEDDIGLCPNPAHVFRDYGEPLLGSLRREWG